MASHARATVLAPYTAPSSKTETKTALFRVFLAERQGSEPCGSLQLPS